MKNYQLYKTNVLLSGQLSWDIIIDNYNGGLYVKDFHITPVSNYVPYNKYSDDEIINYEHRYNIKDFYKKISGYFYSTPVNHLMNNDWPIIKQSDSIIPYDDSYFAGCSRLTYDVYKKSLGYLCPIWLEHINGEKLSFELNIDSGDYNISSKILKLDYLPIDNPIYEYHNKFVTYLYNYLTYINILSEEGCNDVININFARKEAYLKGIDITTGNIIISNISNIIDNLLTRERPLMEFDTYITESFKNSNTIVPNLINFNICFNIDDILARGAASRIIGNQINININAGLFNNEFEKFNKTDIYTNYDYIPRDLCNDIYQLDDSNYEKITPKLPDDINIPNVLDYLMDDKYIEFMNKNKNVQKICHWQLVDNDDYIFNLYDGFGGYVLNGVGEPYLINHRYSNAPDLYQSIYDKKLNNVGWVNTFELNEDKYRYILSNYQTMIDKGYVTKLENGWVNNIKYECDEEYNGKPLYLYVILGYINDPSMDLESLADGKTSSYIGGCLIHTLGSGDILFICSNILNNLTFSAIDNIVNSISSGNSEVGSVGEISGYDGYYYYIPSGNIFTFLSDKLVLQSSTSYLDNNKLYLTNESISIQISDKLKTLKKIFSSIKTIPFIIIDNSLQIVKTDSPSLSCDEIEYYKLNNNRNYLIRYDGKIKPCFGYGDNYLYYKIFSDDGDIGAIKKYSQTGYPPLFKSINYYSYRYEVIEYNKPSKLINNNYEYKWFDVNKYIHLPGEMMFEIQSLDNDITNINNKIKNHLKETFDTNNISDDYYNYILNLYNITYNLLSSDDGNLIYEIKIILK